MRKRARCARTVAILALGVVYACSAPGPVAPTGGSPPPSAPTNSSSSGLIETSPSPAATTTPIESQRPAPTSAANDAPIAFLVIGAQRNAGEVGGFTFGSYSQSAPWLPATALDAVRVPAGAQLRVELDDRATIAGWTARLATAADVTADSVTGLAEGDGPIAEFGAPSAGDWVLSLTIAYGSGLGSGAYYWHLVID